MAAASTPPPGGCQNGIRLDTYDDPAGAGGFYRAYREVARVTYRDVPVLYYELLRRHRGERARRRLTSPRYRCDTHT